MATLGDITEEEWRAYWPTETEVAEAITADEAQAEAEEPVAEDTEPAPDRIPEPSPKEVPEPSPVEVPEPSPTEVPEPSPTEPGPEGPAPEDVSTEEAMVATEESDDREPSEKFTA